jgi:predicted RNA-binding protein with TRAM domain
MNKIFEKNPPVKIGELISAGILGFGKKGNPYVKIEGFVIYIENYKDKIIQLNKMLQMRVIKICKTYAFANIIEPANLSNKK